MISSSSTQRMRATGFATSTRLSDFASRVKSRLQALGQRLLALAAAALFADAVEDRAGRQVGDEQDEGEDNQQANGHGFSFSMRMPLIGRVHRPGGQAPKLYSRSDGRTR
jgi:hypothetical protein